MADTKNINWTGKSGKKYKYQIFKLGTSFKPIAGNYVFSKESKPHIWSPLYFGETSNLSSRFDNHHKMDCAAKNGATHIHVHPNSSSSERLSEESDLIANWNPKCNG